MADDPKSENQPVSGTASDGTPAPQADPAPGNAPSDSPAVTPGISMDAAKEAAGSEDTPKPMAGNIQPDPLSDGTVPQILTTGNGHKSVPKNKVSISSIYRKADVMTTIYTFVGLVVAAGAVIGIYYFLNSKKAPNTPAPKVASLDQTDLQKLGAFFDGNSAGGAAQILTVSSSSLFKNRVAIGSDLKVTGGLQVSGTTALSDLTVDKTSTLGVTNIRGQLVVSGPVNFQSPAQLGAGGSINGNLAVTGNGTFGGALSAGTLNVHDISVSGTINLAGHLSVSGQSGSTTTLAGAGSGASATLDGNDSSGTVTINTGSLPALAPPGYTASYPGGQLVTVNFHTPYPRAPHVVITPVGQTSATIQYFILKTATGFTIGTATQPAPHSSYTFDFWVIQ